MDKLASNWLKSALIPENTCFSVVVGAEFDEKLPSSTLSFDDVDEQ